MIETYFSLTKAEYIESQRLFVQDALGKSRSWRWPLAAFLLLNALWTFFYPHQRLAFTDSPAFAFVWVLLAMSLLFPGHLSRLGFAKRYEKEKVNLTNAHLILDDVGYHTEVPGIGSGVAEWPGIQKWKEGASVFVLKSGFLMRVIPKSSLSPYEQHQVRDLLIAKLGPAA